MALNNQQSSYKRHSQYKLDQKLFLEDVKGDWHTNNTGLYNLLANGKKLKCENQSQKRNIRVSSLNSNYNKTMQQRKIFKIQRDQEPKNDPRKLTFKILPRNNKNYNDALDYYPSSQTIQKKKNQEPVVEQQLLQNKDKPIQRPQYSNNQKKDQKIKTNSIFANNNSFSLLQESKFENNKINSGGLFSRDQKRQNKISLRFKNIFSNQSESIFNFQRQIPPLSKNQKQLFFKNQKHSLFQDEQNGSGNQQQLQKHQKLQSDPFKSTGTYRYQINDKILFCKAVKKFKKNQNSLVGGVQVLINQGNQSKKNWFTARLIETKTCILTGFIIKGVSFVRHFGNKQQNVQLAIISSKQNKRQVQKIHVKLQFDKAQDGKQFLYEIQKLIN